MPPRRRLDSAASIALGGLNNNRCQRLVRAHKGTTIAAVTEQAKPSTTTRQNKAKLKKEKKKKETIIAAVVLVSTRDGEKMGAPIGGRQKSSSGYGTSPPQTKATAVSWALPRQARRSRKTASNDPLAFPGNARAVIVSAAAQQS